MFDDTELEPGKNYVYSATVTTHGNPSAASADAEDCTFPADPQEVRQTAETDATVTVTFSAPEGECESFTRGDKGITTVSCQNRPQKHPKNQKISNFNFTVSLI